MDYQNAHKWLICRKKSIPTIPENGGKDFGDSGMENRALKKKGGLREKFGDTCLLAFSLLISLSPYEIREKDQ